GGVGDAYFAQKSYDRMRELCERHDATLLLVTHDVYSAVRMCDRVIWFDRGRILMDGDGPTVVKAYEDSIRQQEEHRLRIKKQQRMRELQAASGRAAASAASHVVLEVASADGRPQPGLVYLADVSLLVDGERVADWPLGAGAFDASRGSHLERDGSSWGDVTTWQGRVCRPMLNYGSPFHKVGGVFDVRTSLDGVDAASLACAIDYASPEGCDLAVRLYVDGRELSLGRIAGPHDEWTTYKSLATETASAAGVRAVNVSGVHGTGAVAVTGARFVGDDGREVHMLQHGCPAALEIDYAVFRPDLRERCQVVIALHR